MKFTLYDRILKRNDVVWRKHINPSCKQYLYYVLMCIENKGLGAPWSLCDRAALWSQMLFLRAYGEQFWENNIPIVNVIELLMPNEFLRCHSSICYLHEKRIAECRLDCHYVVHWLQGTWGSSHNHKESLHVENCKTKKI